MFDHVTLRVSDTAIPNPFFEAALGALDVAPTSISEKWEVWPSFALTLEDDNHPPTRGLDVGFLAAGPTQVDEFWRVGNDAGASGDTTPGNQRIGGTSAYAAALRDPSGNRVAAVHTGSPRRLDNVVDYVRIGVRNLAAAATFYRTIASAAGLEELTPDADEIVFGASTGARLLLAQGGPTEHLHLAFPGDDAAVQHFHSAATTAGFRDNGKPGERPYHTGYYAAYVLDPDGNNIEVVNHHR